MAEPEHIERTTDEARAGETPGIVRWILGISFVLAIIAMGIVYFANARLDRSHDRPQVTATPLAPR